MRPNKRKRPDFSWPSWRYGPDGEAEIFKCEADVLNGWTKKPGEPEEPRIECPLVRLDRDALLKQLQDSGIIASSKWSTAYIKELVDNGQQQP